MFNINRYSLKFAKIPSVVFLCVLPVLISLGFWQLRRAEEKRLLLDTQAQGMRRETWRLTAASEDDGDRFRYQKVETAGHYDVQHQFLIDNQMNDGKAGYLVLTPLLFPGQNKAVLVNRGWIPMNGNRSTMPELPVTGTQVVITGRINRFPSVGLELPGANQPTAGWPSVVQVVDSEILARRLGYSLFRFQIELDKDMPDGFKREWQTIGIMPPEQHTAYAVQWFGLAVTFTVLFIGFSLKKHDD